MKLRWLLVEKLGDISVIRLNRPKTLNAITSTMIEELDVAFDRCADDSRAIILSSVGRGFSSGANLAGNAVSVGGDDEADAGLLLETHINPLILKFRRLKVPWISAVRGPVAGVACSIALAADMIISSDTAYFLQAFSRIGPVPDGGATWLLTRALGRPRAMEQMLLGERLPADRALELGLINRVVPDSEMDEAALELAKAIAAGPTKAFGLIRQLSWAAADSALEDVLRAERIAQREVGRSNDAAEGIAAFIEKRSSNFIGA